MTTFEDLGLTPDILQAVKRLGFEKPTQVQEESIPHIIQGKDVVAESATGSGKTLAFGSAIIHHVEPKKGIQALILAPTRELAEQVKDSMRTFSHHKPLKIVTIYGGVAMGPQYEHLKIADIVVATPGRLLDHVRQGSIDLKKVKFLVLDEADRMLDMGFIDDVEKIMRECPKERQTLFFSATVAARIRELAQQYMNNPVMVSATKMVDPKKLTQIYYNVQKNQKLSLLAHLLKGEESGLVMVFCNTRRTTDFVVSNLKNNGIKAIAIHGGLSQNKRSKTMDIFGNAKVGVLVCTDVAARGLHIDDVSHVYNYEIPNDPKEYVHRIGRTARAGSDGKVINLLSDVDHGNFYRVLDEFRDYKIEKVETPEFERLHARKVEDSGDSRGGRGGFRGGPRRGGFGGRGGSSGPRRGGPSRGGPRRGGPRSGGHGRSSGGGRQWGVRPDKPARD